MNTKTVEIQINASAVLQLPRSAVHESIYNVAIQRILSVPRTLPR